MRNLRFNIASILGVILFVAVGFAALREADDVWDSGLFSLTLGLLLASVLLAVHRTEARRAFWIGFALFGWGYLGLCLVPSIESRLITTKALAYLDQAYILGHRAYAMRAFLDRDRMRAYNVSAAGVMMAVNEQGMIGSPGRLGQATGKTSQKIGYVLTWVGRYNKPQQYENIILRANSEGEILRLKDVAKVELGSSFYTLGVWAGTTENFIRIGHSLFALLAGWLGGMVSRRLGRVSVAPEVSTEERAVG